jgi:S1-C subfamily serine protease
LLADNTPLDERLGLRTVAATQAALARRGLPDRPGALVMRVERDSAADLAGIPMSSLIVNADGKEITSPQSLAIALSSAEGDVELTYCIGGEERTCRVQIGK